METRELHCTLCEGIFKVSTVLPKKADDHYYCNTCEQTLYALEHRHSLSVHVSSLEEFTDVASRLAQIDQPATSAYYSHHSCLSRSSAENDAYRLCYYYEQVSMNLLKALAPLRTRYTLHDIVTHKDSLRFWPDYSVPQGVFASLI